MQCRLQLLCPASRCCSVLHYSTLNSTYSTWKQFHYPCKIWNLSTSNTHADHTDFNPPLHPHQLVHSSIEELMDRDQASNNHLALPLRRKKQSLLNQGEILVFRCRKDSSTWCLECLDKAETETATRGWRTGCYYELLYNK